MKILKIFGALVIAYVSFKISISITNSLVHFEMGMGMWVINLFFLSPIYLLVLFGFTGLIGFGTWNILNYILTFSAVSTENNRDPGEYRDTKHPKTKRTSIIAVLGNTLMGVLGMIGVAIIILIIGVASFSKMGKSFSKSNQTRFEQMFDTVYPNTSYGHEEFNVKASEVAASDYRFIYYLKELNIASDNFVYAEKVVDIFEADVKRTLAIACMRDVLIEKVANTGFGTMKGYKMNALNAVGNKGKAMKNFTLMDKGRSVYHHPQTDGYGPYILGKDYGNRCNETMTVDDMFDKYLPIYLKNMKIYADKARVSENKGRARHSAKLYAWIDQLYKIEAFKN